MTQPLTDFDRGVQHGRELQEGESRLNRIESELASTRMELEQLSRQHAELVASHAQTQTVAEVALLEATTEEHHEETETAPEVVASEVVAAVAEQTAEQTAEEVVAEVEEETPEVTEIPSNEPAHEEVKEETKEETSSSRKRRGSYGRNR